jgi:serine O-acetyltransferase
MKLIKDFIYKSECYFGQSDTKGILRVLISDGSSAMILYRVSYGLNKIGLGILALPFLMLNKLLNGCVIGYKAQFEEGFVIMHPVGVVINGAVKGGRNIVVESGVVIGAAKNGLPVKVPVLGNNIYIGSGAKIFGDITIGNNVKIGANSVVVKNIPDNVTVVGIPARVVPGV